MIAFHPISSPLLQLLCSTGRLMSRRRLVPFPPRAAWQPPQRSRRSREHLLRARHAGLFGPRHRRYHTRVWAFKGIWVPLIAFPRRTNGVKRGWGRVCCSLSHHANRTHIPTCRFTVSWAEPFTRDGSVDAYQVSLYVVGSSVPLSVTTVHGLSTTFTGLVPESDYNVTIRYPLKPAVFFFFFFFFV